MKVKAYTKRTLSLILCVVMLVSCWVFTVPSANATDTWYAGNSSVKNSSTTAHTGTDMLTSNRTGKYRVRLLVKEITQFDEAIHDRPGSMFNSKDFPYEPGFAFGPNDSDSQRNLNGTSTSQDLGTNEVSRDSSLTQHKYWCEYAKISYKTMNGSSAGADGAVWFNLGDQDDAGRQDGISGGGWNWGYFPSDDGVVIDGFPTGFTTRYYNTKQIDGKKEYYHVWLQVAKWTGTNSWNWDDYGGTCTNGKNIFGNASVDDKYCKGIADVGCNMNSSSKVNELKVSQTVDASKLPYATTGTSSVNSTTAMTTAPTVNFTTTSSTAQVSSITLPSASGTTDSRRVYYTDPYDQYGAVMASTIQLNYTQSGKKSFFTQTGTTTGFAYGANIDGDTDTQKLRAYVTWPSASNAATALTAYSNELTVNDASYTVSFKSEDGSVTYTTDPSSFQYGHTPAYNGTTPTKTETPPVYAYTHDGWSSTVDGDKLTSLPAVTGDSNKTFYAYFSKAKIPYTITYKDADGNVIKTVENLDYGTVPADLTGANAVPAFVEKESDNLYHYNPSWTNEGGKTLNDPIEGNTIFTIAYTAVEHTLSGEGTVTKEPTCVEKGTKVFTCTVCSHDVEEDIAINPLGHQLDLAETQAPSDGSNGKIVFHCSLCNKYFAAKDENGEYNAIIEDENREPITGAATAGGVSGSADIPSPQFNAYNDDTISYQYSDRGASLKLTKETEDGINTIQKMRFSGSVKVPDNVDTIADTSNTFENVGTASKPNYQLKSKEALEADTTIDDCILDFGFVYTQMQHIADIVNDEYKPDLSQMVIGGDNENIYQMSVPSKNIGADPLNIKADSSTWTGVTSHCKDGVTQLTFNLLINVKEKNWKRIYAARTYIIYKYHGEIYTVYDGINSNEGSARAVWYVAKATLAKYGTVDTQDYTPDYNDETTQIGRMCKFLRDNITEKEDIESLIQSGGRGSDWWQYRNECRDLYGFEGFDPVEGIDYEI